MPAKRFKLVLERGWGSWWSFENTHPEGDDGARPSNIWLHEREIRALLKEAKRHGILA